jgi:hypothetical protein
MIGNLIEIVYPGRPTATVQTAWPTSESPPARLPERALSRPTLLLPDPTSASPTPASRVATTAMCRPSNRSLSPSSSAMLREANLLHLSRRSAPSRSCAPAAGCHRRAAAPQAPKAAAPSSILRPSAASRANSRGAPRSIERHWVLPWPEHLHIAGCLGSLSGATFSSMSSTAMPRCSLARPPAPPTAPTA